jgi:hypothetical protein
LIALPALSLFSHVPSSAFAAFCLLTEGAFCFYTFRGDSQFSVPVSLTISLVVLTALSGLVLSFYWYMLYHNAYFTFFQKYLSSSQIGNTLQGILAVTGVIAAAFGMVALKKCKTSGSNWRALFLLGLTVIALLSHTLEIMRNMNSQEITLQLGTPMFVRFCVTALVGFSLSALALRHKKGWRFS